jgi:hypothetical protein
MVYGLKGHSVILRNPMLISPPPIRRLRGRPRSHPRVFPRPDGTVTCAASRARPYRRRRDRLRCQAQAQLGR